MYELKICHLYSNLLNLYGDIGNITALVKRSEWRGIKATVANVTIGERFVPENYDIVFLGSGQDYEQKIAQSDLLKDKSNEVNNAIKNNKIFLCICAGYQMLGKFYKTLDGKDIELLGALNIWTIESKKRMVGNMVFQCDFLMSNDCDGKIAGFENHSGKTYLGPEVKPMGKILRGYGNNGEDGYEGAIYKNVYCSYSHGSLLPKNPALTDHLITKALKQKYKDFTGLLKLDDNFERLAHDSMIKRIMGR